MPPMAMKRIRSGMGCIAVLGLACAGGCLRIQEASSLRLQPASEAPAARSAPGARPGSKSESIWPKRWSSDPDIRGVIRPLEGSLSEWEGVRLGEDHYLRSTPEEAADAEAVARIAGTDKGYQYIVEGPGAFLFRPVRGDWKSRATNSKPDAMFKFVSARPLGPTNGVEVVTLERTWFGYYDRQPGTEARGLIVMVPGLFGVPEPVNDRFVELCQQDGWAVLRMLAHPSRFTERVRFPIDIEDLGGSAQRIADELGQRAAETAYAAQAGVRQVHKLRPDLVDQSHVLVGMSGGAIAGPTVHALEPDLYDAAVLVAGGANFLLINEGSNYASWVQAMDLDWGEANLTGTEEREALAKLSREYLARAPLDGYHVAELLKDKPVLVLQGSSDKAVPSHFGDVLWEKLGKPDRWVFPAGHELLFLTLNNMTPNMLRWIDEHTGPSAVGRAKPEPEAGR